MNGKRRTTEDFINDSQLIHGDKYEYSKSIFTKRKSKVIIICPIHGEFEQTACSHLKGKGCDKSYRCLLKGITLIHIEEVDWKANKKYIMNNLKNLILE